MTTLLALVSIVVVVAFYVRCLTTIVYDNRLRYRISDLFALSTAIAILAASGCVWDVLTVGFLILYSILGGPLWRRFVRKWTSCDITTAIWTSAGIVSSFIVVLTVVCILVVVFAPAPFEYCTTLYWALYSSFYVSFEFIWGDNYDTEAQLFLYGLPFGLPLNLAIGLFVGAGLGRIAHSLKSPQVNDESGEVLTTLGVLRSMAILTIVYVRRLASIVCGTRLTYRLGDMFALSTAIAIVAAAGFERYIPAVLTLILYAMLSGSRWRRFVSRWTTGDLSTSICTSAGILSSFVAVLTVVCVLVFLLVPLGYWWFRSSATFNLAMYSSYYSSSALRWLFEVNGGTRLRLYGFPFGLMLNIVVGLLAGAALGLVAHSIRTFDSIQQ